MNNVEREAVRITAVLLSTERWAKSYKQTPQQHADLIKSQAELNVVLIKFFKNMQKKVRDFVNWDHYNYQLSLDYNIKVIVNDQQIDNEDTNFIKVTLATVTKSVQAGFAAEEIRSGVPSGIGSTSELIQKASLKQVAALVGKTVNDDGSIVGNPNADFNVIDSVRNDIAQSIKTSLGLGETTDEAIVRMAKIINPVQRAQLIANTESVNAYQAGVTSFGEQSDAKQKEWETDSDPCPICEENATDSPVAFDDDFTSGDDAPTAHPNCMCSMRLIYQNEIDNAGAINPAAAANAIIPDDD